MIRIARAAAIIVAGLSLTACSAVPQRNVAAATDHATLTQDELNDILGSELARALLDIPLEASRYPTDAAVAVVNRWIVANALPDDAIPADDGTTAEGLAAEYAGAWDSAPEVFQELLIRLAQLNVAIQSGELTEQQLADALAEQPPTVWSRLGAWQGPELGVQPLGR